MLDVPSYVSRMQKIIANPSVAHPGELEKKKGRPVQVQYYRHLIDITLKLSVYKFTVSLSVNLSTFLSYCNTLTIAPVLHYLAIINSCVYISQTVIALLNLLHQYCTIHGCIAVRT